MAADDGQVANVGIGNTGYGNYVVIVHPGGLLTLYGHLSQAVVRAGDRVVQGQPIGLESSTGPRLHFELRVGRVPVDPRRYLPAVRRPTPASDLSARGRPAETLRRRSAGR